VCERRSLAEVLVRLSYHIVTYHMNHSVAFSQDNPVLRKFCRMQSIHSQSLYIRVYLLYVTWTTCFDLSIF